MGIGRVERYSKVQGTRYQVQRFQFTIERLTIYHFKTYGRIDLGTYRRKGQDSIPRKWRKLMKN